VRTRTARCSAQSATTGTGRLDKALTPDMLYRLVRGYSALLGNVAPTDALPVVRFCGIRPQRSRSRLRCPAFASINRRYPAPERVLPRSC
jgi:hypothetical protein